MLPAEQRQPCAVHYQCSGPLGAPAVVLTGSLGATLSMWDPQADALASHLQVVRYDLRGHGSSPVPAGPYAMADLGGDLLALMDRLEIERAALCGLSIGGMVSIWIAAHAPERVQRLVLCCTSAVLGPAESWHERAATVREQGVQAVAGTVLERWFTRGYARRQPEVVQRMLQMLTATPSEGYAGCCEAIAAMDLRADLARIKAPTLVLSGAEDPVSPPEHGRLIVEGIGSAALTVIPQAAHLATVERAELATMLILRFLVPVEEAVPVRSREPR